MNKTFKRTEINSIAEQLKAIQLNDEPVFAVHQEDGITGVDVQLKVGGITQWIYFRFDPSEPETEPAKMARLSIY